LSLQLRLRPNPKKRVDGNPELHGQALRSTSLSLKPTRIINPCYSASAASEIGRCGAVRCFSGLVRLNLVKVVILRWCVRNLDTVPPDCAIQLTQQLGKEDLHPHDSVQSFHPLFAQMQLELCDIVKNFQSIPKGDKSTCLIRKPQEALAKAKTR
jgi:hypothetical protein